MAGASFLPVFDAEYAGKLGLCGETMRRVFEIHWHNPHPSALHHLHEPCAIMP